MPITLKHTDTRFQQALNLGRVAFLNEVERYDPANDNRIAALLESVTTHLGVDANSLGIAAGLPTEFIDVNAPNWQQPNKKQRRLIKRAVVGILNARTDK